MSETTITRLQTCLDRLRAGHVQARDELITHAHERLTALARMIFQDFPKLRSAIETGDVVNDAYLRLRRALEQVAPENVRDFFRLAALQIRRVLLDVVRQREGRDGERRPPISFPDSESARGGEPAETTYDPSRLAAWREFHEAVEKLPPEEREAVDLLWYQELSQEEAAELLGVDKSTVKRRWRRAREKLAHVLG
jgi:RNA polymerase sigma-70 factor (ECF subfamily)